MSRCQYYRQSSFPSDKELNQLNLRKTREVDVHKLFYLVLKSALPQLVTRHVVLLELRSLKRHIRSIHRKLVSLASIEMAYNQCVNLSSWLPCNCCTFVDNNYWYPDPDQNYKEKRSEPVKPSWSSQLVLPNILFSNTLTSSDDCGYTSSSECAESSSGAYYASDEIDLFEYHDRNYPMLKKHKHREPPAHRKEARLNRIVKFKDDTTESDPGTQPSYTEMKKKQYPRYREKMHIMCPINEDSDSYSSLDESMWSSPSEYESSSCSFVPPNPRPSCTKRLPARDRDAWTDTSSDNSHMSSTVHSIHSHSD